MFLDVHAKRKAFDDVLPNKFVTGQDLAIVNDSSGISGLDGAGRNVGGVEPHNITVNKQKLGESLKEYLIGKGVEFTYGEEVKLVTEDDKINHIERDDGLTISGNKLGSNS